ncbi:hypothetical protein [Pseudoalteromonas arctica]|uniref:hypothetical protein n=1 Tax=Pseudoalteromonas arctica TaxID=394751 RepID=UPI0024942A63|nr:hypothetical protein [Pseudoalteromonas arctica]
MDTLKTDKRDRLVSVAKAASGVLPFIGTAVSELMDNVVPNLRFERVVIFLRELDERVSKVDKDLEFFKKNLDTELGVDLLEEALTQSSRSISKDRKKRLASIAEKALTKEKLKYEEARKVLNLYRELTDPEIIWLIYYSFRPTLGHGPHSEWMEKHPNVLRPISRELSAPLEKRELAALQDSYKETLLRFGLIEVKGKSASITTLGRMVVNYITDAVDES